MASNFNDLASAKRLYLAMNDSSLSPDFGLLRLDGLPEWAIDADGERLWFASLPLYEIEAIVRGEKAAANEARALKRSIPKGKEPDPERKSNDGRL